MLIIILIFLSNLTEFYYHFYADIFYFKAKECDRMVNHKFYFILAYLFNLLVFLNLTF